MYLQQTNNIATYTNNMEFHFKMVLHNIKNK